MDSWSNIHQVVSILLDNVYSEYYTEILFAWCTDTSFDVHIIWTPVVSVLNNIFLSAQVE